MIRLREIIIAEVGELSDGAEAVLELLKEISRDSFTKTLEQITAQIEIFINHYKITIFIVL